MCPGEGGAVEAHYALGDLGPRILEALRRAGLDPDQLSPDDLAPVDEFHVRGREATEELAELAGLVAGQRVLDVGSGLGGTARHLADRHGVEVTGVDLTEEYCRVGNMLSERTGLRDRVELVTADAVELPFADGGFDVVWTEHAAMNIEDKPRLYRELRRVLRPGGRLAIYDILQGPGGEVHFPVPWARRPEISFLVSPAELRALLERCSFKVLAWQDATAPAVSWFRVRVQRKQGWRTENSTLLDEHARQRAVAETRSWLSRDGAYGSARWPAPANHYTYRGSAGWRRGRASAESWSDASHQGSFAGFGPVV